MTDERSLPDIDLTSTDRAAADLVFAVSTVDELVAQNQSMARRLARRYSNGLGIDEDLLQVAQLGLVTAAHRFDPNLGSFRPFAVATVAGELKKHLRNTGWSVRVSRSVQEDSITVERARGELEQSLGRSPTPADIAEHTGLDVESVLTAARVRQVRFSDPLPVIDPATDDLDLTGALIVNDALSQLSHADQALLRLRHVHGFTQREIAGELGISQTQTHRRLSAAYARLRRIFGEMEYAP